MFGLRPLVSIFTFWWPLLISFKALQAPGENIEFLLVYWLFYAAISGIQHQMLGMNIPFSSLINLAGDVLQIWMFYSHGCLVVLHYYIPASTGRTVISIAESLDHKVIDPIVTMAWVRNRILQTFLKTRSSSIPLLDDFLLFNQSLCEHHASSPQRLSFLQFSLEYFCYIDHESELRARYLKSRGVLARISSSISIPKQTLGHLAGQASIQSLRSSRQTSRVCSETEKTRNVSSSSVKSGHSAWRSAPQSRLNSGRVSRNVSSQGLDAIHTRSINISLDPDSATSKGSETRPDESKGPSKAFRVSSMPVAGREPRNAPGHVTRLASDRLHYADHSTQSSVGPSGDGPAIHVKKRARARASSFSWANPPYPIN